MAGKRKVRAERAHWFADKDLDVLLFKVNRRVQGRGTLFEGAMREAQPDDALQHVHENLTLWQPQAESGRRHKRNWQVGNLSRSHEGDVLVGRVGWQRSGQAIATVYDLNNQQWIDQQVPDDVSAVSPFALIADGRILGVLRHTSFSGTVLAKVFTDLLNSAERQREFSTTDFDVEPIGDSQEFFGWVDTVDRVTKVEFAFKRPNPDAEDSFRELFDRQEAYQADEIREIIKSSGPDQGLNKTAFHTDRVANMFLAAAMAAYGYVTASGQRNGRPTRFDQRANVAKEAIAAVGDSWEAATAEVVEATRRGRRRRRSDG